MSRNLFADPFFAEPPGPVRIREAAAAHQREAAESIDASAADGIAADAGRREPDPDWQPL